MTALELRWRAAVHSLECCVLCQRHGVQWAHGNEGKGTALKVPPWESAALCPECHHEIDNGNRLTQDERRSLMARAIVRTHTKLIQTGKLRLIA